MTRRTSITNGDAMTRRSTARDLLVRRASAKGDWCRIENKKSDKGSADIYIYDEIGFWGTTAQNFATQIADLDVDKFNLHINSPGGDMFDGIAIYNSLKNHKAKVTVYVDGLAASAASFIAQSGDEIIMGMA